MSKTLEEHKTDFFMVRLLECLQLLLCLLVINALTLKLRLKATFLRLQNCYLTFRIRKTVKRKQDAIRQTAGREKGRGEVEDL